MVKYGTYAFQNLPKNIIETQFQASIHNLGISAIYDFNTEINSPKNYTQLFMTVFKKKSKQNN